jgi:hypothetical protein
MPNDLKLPKQYSVRQQRLQLFSEMANCSNKAKITNTEFQTIANSIDTFDCDRFVSNTKTYKPQTTIFE